MPEAGYLDRQKAQLLRNGIGKHGGIMLSLPILISGKDKKLS